MSSTSNRQRTLLRRRLELGRLRAVGELSRRLLVDGQSIQKWCLGSGVPFQQAIGEIVTAATDGQREVVVVTDVALTLAPPHRVVGAPARSISAYLWSPAFIAHYTDMLTVVTTDVKLYTETLATLPAGVSSVLDVQTGRLHYQNTSAYDVPSVVAESKALGVGLYATTIARALAAPLSASAGLFVAARWHRDANDRVVLDEVGVDAEARRYATGHTQCLQLLGEVISTQGVPVVTTSLDVLDALHVAGLPLPRAVRDPALASVVLDPDQQTPPLGISAVWGQTFGERPESSRIDVGRVLDELPSTMQELEDQLQLEGLLALFRDDVSETLPVFAAIESTGFYVDSIGIPTDITTLQQVMTTYIRDIIQGPGGREYAGIDLLRSSHEEVGELLVRSEGPLPFDWQVQRPTLKRYALYGVPRALKIQELRSSATTLRWLERIQHKPQLVSTVEPAATGRWYPTGNPLAAMPKHSTTAQLLRKHLVPPPGHMFVSGDFAAFEPRLLAHLSQDPVLLSAAKSPNNFYDEMGKTIGLSQTDTVKAAWLAFVYGRAVESFAETLALPMRQGFDAFNHLKQKLKHTFRYKKNFERGLHVGPHGAFAYDPIGNWRRRSTPGLSWPQFKRRAFNLLMQGGAATLLRRLLRELHNGLPPEAKIVHQEFDAVILACPIGMEVQVEQLLQTTMEHIDKLSVPLRARVKHGATLAAVT